MKLQELAEKLELKNRTKVFDKDISGVYISDMVSDVIAANRQLLEDVQYRLRKMEADRAKEEPANGPTDPETSTRRNP